MTDDARQGYADDGDGAKMRLIQQDARQRLLFEPGGEANLAIIDRVMRAGESVALPDRTLKIERDTVLVFRDEAPLQNWGHACSYIHYDPDDGVPYNVVKAQFPPDLVRPLPELRHFHQPIVHRSPELVLAPGLVVSWPFRPIGKWYAVLYSGGSNNRHTNDLEYLYRVLRNDYGLPPDRIYVLNFDGTLNYSGGPQPATTWPGNSTGYTMPVNSAGTKAELEAVFDEIAGRLGPTDSLLIHTNNHGGRDVGAGKSYLCVHSGPNYYEDEFAAKLAELPKFRCLMVMMEQCYAGGFNQPIIDNSPAFRTSVASAANATSTSIGGWDFDPFARDWISAINLAGPDGSALGTNPDTDGSGRVSAREAFAYADSVHDPWDTPVYSESSAAAGRCCIGKSPSPWWPRLPWLIARHDWRLPYPLLLEEIERRLPALVKELERDDLTVRQAGSLLELHLGELMVGEREEG